MATFQPFLRSIGSQPGVQLNMPIDQTERASSSSNDQVIAVVGRFTRGAIDRNISVDRSNIGRKLGPAQSIRNSAENAPSVVLREALDTGARSAVVARLVNSTAAKSYAVVGIPSGTATLTATIAAGAVTGITVTNAGTNYKSGAWLSIVGGGGSGAKARIATNATGGITGVTGLVGGSGYTTAPAVIASNDLWYSVSPTEPADGSYLMYLDDANCWNSGVVLEVHADKTPLSGSAVANSSLILRVIDPIDGTVVLQVSGSLSPQARDSNGQSEYLPDVIQRVDPTYRLVCASGGAIPSWCENAYGRGTSGTDNWARSSTLSLFSEGAIGGYPQTVYATAVDRLTYSEKPFGMLITGGLYNPTLVTLLGGAAKTLNLPLIIDVDGRLTAQGAIDYVSGLGLPNDAAHLFSAYWAPVESFDQYNSYFEVIGVSGLQAGARATRNANINSKGFAPKNYAIAGYRYPLQRIKARQITVVKDSELSDLARAGLNPVVYESSGGGSYQFGDSLTLVASGTSDRRLVTVGEMASQIENMLAGIAKQLIHLPMREAMEEMTYQANRLMADAEAARWLVPAESLSGKSFVVSIEANAANPKTVMNVVIFASYDGVLRQAFLSQTISG